MATRRAKISGALGVAASVATILGFFATAGGSSSPAAAPAAASSPAASVPGYPQNVQDNYLNGCEVNAPVQSCQCTLDWFQANVSLARFEQDNAEAAQGQVPADLSSAIAACQ